MRKYEFFAADNYDFYGGTGDDADAVSAISFVPGRETDTEVYSVSWQGAAGGGIWVTGCILPEKCTYLYGQSRSAGTDCNYSCGGAAYVETADASVYRGRNSMLYATCPVCFLKVRSKKYWKRE